MNDTAIHVLLIEDNPDDAFLIQEMLDEAGGKSRRFVVTHTERLVTGMERLARNRIDVVLLDLGLPDSQGLETFATAHARAPSVPIVVLSGLDDEALALEAVEQGAQDYLVKGQVEGRSLLRALRYAIERQRAEEALQQHAEQLEERVAERTKALEEAHERLVRQEKLAVLGQLAGGVGHELRNPLGAIKNAAYFVNLSLPEPEPDVKEALEILTREVDTAERIISSLLGFARTKRPSRREMSLNDITREALSRTAVPDTVSVCCELDETLPPILADPDQLAQVCGNLIGNAIQAMPEGGRLVVKTARRSRTEVDISVADTGVGIPEENLERVFEPLFTTKAKGIGLGLALVKTLVEAHGGTVEVESAVGQGSTFSVRLPIDTIKG